MLTIFKKEIAGFFSSLIAYISIVVFLLVTGLFVWVFPDTSILEYGFASMDSFFGIAPWIFLFLIPAITMRSFSEENKSGTIELLVTRPITELQIILGKYFAGLTIVVLAILPTLMYYVTVYQLGAVKGNVDIGAVIGSYIGLIFLAASLVSIGIFASSLSDNQIIAFIVAVFISFICYAGFDSFSKLDLFGKVDNIIASVGINEHYQSMSRGVLDSRDAIYFIGFISFFVLLTRMVLESRKW
ncbi:MAG: gliding motility-associated ABC transporter permease subunit GldF [Sphingobacteriales bacterium]|nr:gliding motility-associated ABC transporter permease subunit GldF [Sphingobacteriales bacterium]